MFNLIIVVGTVKNKYRWIGMAWGFKNNPVNVTDSWWDCRPIETAGRDKFNLIIVVGTVKNKYRWILMAWGFKNNPFNVTDSWWDCRPIETAGRDSHFDLIILPKPFVTVRINYIMIAWGITENIVH